LGELWGSQLPDETSCKRSVQIAAHIRCRGLRKGVRISNRLFPLEDRPLEVQTERKRKMMGARKLKTSGRIGFFSKHGREGKEKMHTF